ncbi:hypothetical protein QBC44DRAFT_325315 [Cladorrhinum sp. PSN332]|nr:hypothetical protein QBC44DRAFT_325315 [Cladorrhinum sp. PSN332]
MPRQYVVFGRPVPRLGARRVSLLLLTLALFAIFSLIFTLPSSIPTGPSLTTAGQTLSHAGEKLTAAGGKLSTSLKSPWITKLNPFKQPSHAPPRQKNDTDGDSWWYSDWKWLSMPFSSSITLDENRALLPVLKERTPIYCYYDNTLDKERASKDAESELLLSWRRAWWAQGFRPIILSPAEAMNNPVYEELQKLKDIKPALRTDLMRWLAWENMGGGLLASNYLFPMGAHDDALLSYLRRGEFPKLTKWQDLDEGLFVGPKADVHAAIKLVMSSSNLASSQSLVAAIRNDKTTDPFTTDAAPKSLAFYSSHVINSQYSKLGDAITTSRATGLKSLNQLIISHLHLTWQNIFSKGIAVVKPIPHHTTYLITPAYKLASRLAHCPESPLPNSCPPNAPKCTPCDDERPLKITTPAHYNNDTSLFTIGVVPHPYTSTTLISLRRELDIRYIRRESARDPWITDLTAEISPEGIPAAPRVLRFKEAVASEKSHFRSLWLPAEQLPIPDPDLDWIFGFQIPSEASYADSPSENGGVPTHDPKDGPVPTEQELKMEPVLIEKARKVVNAQSGGKPKQQGPGIGGVKEAVEAWNLADVEAWRFARAYLARQTVERRKWEEEEAKYADGMGSESGRRE